MTIKAFFGDVLGQALALGIGTPDDVLRHVTPDVLAAHLPRPLWARLIAACLGATRLDAKLVVDTIGVPNLCEHVPGTILWACIAELGTRSLGGGFTASPPILTRPTPTTPVEAVRAVAEAPSRPTPQPGMLTPPPPAAAAAPPAKLEKTANLPPVDKAPAEKAAADKAAAEKAAAEAPTDGERAARGPSSQRFRQSNTGIGRTGFAATQPRRPNAAAAAPAPPAAPPVTVPPKRRPPTDIEVDVEMDGDWKPRDIAVDDSQLVDWAEPTRATEEDFSDIGRKR